MPNLDPQSQLVSPELVISAFQTVDMPMALWDREFRLQCCNRSYERFSGQTHAQAAGKTFTQIYGVNAYETSIGHFKQALTGKTVTFDRLMYHDPTDGRWFRIRLVPAGVDAQGNTSGIFSLLIDVDDHVKRLDAALLSAKRIQRVLGAIDLPIGCWDAGNRLTYCNEPYERWARRDRDQLIGKTLEELYGPNAWAAARPAFEKAFTGHTADYTRLVQHQEQDHWMRITAFPDSDDEGNVIAVYTIAFDIDDEIRAIDELAKSKRRLDMLSANIPYPLTYIDRDFIYRFINKAFAQRFNVNPQEAIGKHVRIVRGEQVWKEHSPYALMALAGKDTKYERLVEQPNGARRWIRSSYMPDMDESGHVRGVYTATIDIHDIKMAQEAMTRRAERDSLTDAYNRSFLMARLERLMNHSDISPFTLFFVDLDGFKLVNDTCGHAAGDALLKTIAQRLQESVRGSEIVARFGGDEFVLITSAVDETAINSMAQRILAAACAPLQFENHTLQVTASVGVAIAPMHARTVQQLMRRADEAMYAAKGLGKNAWSICSTPDAASAQTA